MTTRAATAAETADKILAATKQLFTENTIAEITLAAIAQRSDVTVQTILRRFGVRLPKQGTPHPKVR